MTASLDMRKEFVADFQNKIIIARKLLFAANHKWASKMLDNLGMEIEKNEWLDLQKKHQLYMIISNSWWIYLNSLIRRKEGNVKIDLIRYIDGYKRFFAFLASLDDPYLLNNFGINLLKQFIKMADLSQVGITKFVNSFSNKLQQREDYQKLIELQILLMYLRNSVAPSEHFHLSMEILGKTLFKLEPSKRTLFLYMILENVCIKYQLMEDSSEFVRIIVKILINRLPQYLKSEFSSLSRISINERSFNTILIDLEEIINYLNDIGKYPWIIIIIRNIFSKIQEYQSFGDAVTYIRKFIDFSINRNRFEIAFEIYDFLEDLFIYQTDLSYDNILIELWVEACKKFVDMKEKKYLLQSLEKLNNHLKMPQTSAQIYHYFYTCDKLWQFKSMFFSLEQRDFWRMMFYRALFEEKNFKIAQNILPYLDKDFCNLITDVVALSEEVEPLKEQIYSFGTEEKFHFLHEGDFVIKDMILRITSNGNISYRINSTDNQIIEGTIKTENWNDAQILEIYNELFYEPEKRKFSFTLNEFGELLYIFLPKLIRDFFKSFKIKSLNIIPQIYFILDSMTIPFDLIYDNNFFLLKYSSGYKIGEIPLGGIAFEQESMIESPSVSPEMKYNILIIDSINSKIPLKWNDKLQRKELIYPFSAGANELDYIVNFFNRIDEIGQLTALIGSSSTKEAITAHLAKDLYHIIVFVGNIFYSKWSPKDSFFLANDNKIITFSEIYSYLNQRNARLQPFLFFNAQIFDIEGQKLRNVLSPFGEILTQFNQDNITGIIVRPYPLFNEETKEIISEFFLKLLRNNSQGVSLLKARQQCIANKMEKMVEEQFKDTSIEGGTTRIDLRSSLAVSSYLLFGQPWKKIKP
ncbi:MAG: hypothetical protein KGD65_13745 [Candidatus Lokiarchaeota archaeon]|nr:hypothetical protein [Candidatus Lokiarchaeota archaeon]